MNRLLKFIVAAGRRRAVGAELIAGRDSLATAVAFFEQALAVDPECAEAQGFPSPAALAEREARLREAGIPAAPIVALSRPFEDPVPPDLASDQFDLVTLMFNYHDLGHLGVDRARMNTAVFRALKPGGLFVIADHAGRRRTGISESGTNPS